MQANLSFADLQKRNQEIEDKIKSLGDQITQLEQKQNLGKQKRPSFLSLCNKQLHFHQQISKTTNGFRSKLCLL